MKFYVLGSGSKGNCTVIQSLSTTIMIDCGLSKRKTEKKLNELNLSLEDIDYVLITHEHSDHIKGIKMFDLKKVYSGKDTIVDLGANNILKSQQEIQLGNIKIIPFAISHDAICPLGYIVEGDETLVYMTDTGYVSQKNYKLIKNKHYYIVESNHDISMLMSSSRPDFLKTRILGDRGHLENNYSAKVMSDSIGDNTKLIVLAHLSEQVNTPELALEAYKNTFSNYDIKFKDFKVASQEGILCGGCLDEN